MLAVRRSDDLAVRFVQTLDLLGGLRLSVQLLLDLSAAVRFLVLPACRHRASNLRIVGFVPPREEAATSYRLISFGRNYVPAAFTYLASASNGQTRR